MEIIIDNFHINLEKEVYFSVAKIAAETGKAREKYYECTGW